MNEETIAIKQQAETYTGTVEDDEVDPADVADEQPESGDYIPPPDEVSVGHSPVIYVCLLAFICVCCDNYSIHGTLLSLLSNALWKTSSNCIKRLLLMLLLMVEVIHAPTDDVRVGDSIHCNQTPTGTPPAVLC